MTRRLIICIASTSAAISVAIVLALATAFASKQAINDTLDELTALNQRVIEHTNHAYDEAVDSLRLMDKTQFLPCSDEHIAKMRQVTANHWQIAGMAYFQGDLLRCSAWGPLKTPIERAPIDFINTDGVKISVSLTPRVSRSDPRIGLYLNNYGVLIDPHVLLHSLTDPSNQFAVAIEGRAVLATKNNPDPRLLRALTQNPASGFDKNLIYAAMTEDGITAVAMKPRNAIASRFNREMIEFLPLGILVSCVLVSGIVWVARRRLSPLGELRVAVRNRQFIVHYQPIVHIPSGICVGAEALVRQRRNGKIVSPAEFIPLAEASGLILPITDQVIACVLRDLGPALRADPSMHVSINLSASDVSTGRAIDVLDKAMKDSGISKKQIWLEATEHGFVNVDGAQNAIAKARAQGYAIAIDDFGTGFSSLQYLESLAIDALKIDKSFVDTIGKNTSKSRVLPHIIEIARSLNLTSIAEGVETEEQLDYLRNEGVAMAQGWLISKPLPHEAFLAFHESRNAGLALRQNERSDIQGFR